MCPEVTHELDEEDDGGSLIICCQGPPLCDFLCGDDQDPSPFMNMCKFCIRIYIDEFGNETKDNPCDLAN